MVSKEYTLVIYCVLSLVLVLPSCSEMVDSAESEAFIVEVIDSYDILDILVHSKKDNSEYRALRVDRDPYAEAEFLDDSILVVTNIDGLEGQFGLIANLQAFYSFEIRLMERPTMFIEGARELDKLTSGDWTIILYEVKEQDDMCVLKVQSPQAFKNRIGEHRVIVQGAKLIELVSSKDGLLEIAINWKKNPSGSSPQVFRLDFPDEGRLTPEIFSVLH
ncbi:MAG: hypothetical protein GY834_04550 [Bacteroidetes bacterium]|nr:hypothetical protein [Bacteroidota bacterium]